MMGPLTTCVMQSPLPFSRRMWHRDVYRCWESHLGTWGIGGVAWGAGKFGGKSWRWGLINGVAVKATATNGNYIPDWNSNDEYPAIVIVSVSIPIPVK